MIVLKSIKSILQAALTLAVVFAYGFSPLLAIEIEHQHHADSSHDSDLAEHGSHHHHDTLEHCPAAPVDHEEPADSQEYPSHSHLISFDVCGPAIAWNSKPCPLPLVAATVFPLVHGEICPDGPTFDLIKPPQLA